MVWVCVPRSIVLGLLVLDNGFEGATTGGRFFEATVFDWSPDGAEDGLDAAALFAAKGDG